MYVLAWRYIFTFHWKFTAKQIKNNRKASQEEKKKPAKTTNVKVSAKHTRCSWSIKFTFCANSHTSTRSLWVHRALLCSSVTLASAVHVRWAGAVVPIKRENGVVCMYVWYLILLHTFCFFFFFRLAFAVSFNVIYWTCCNRLQQAQLNWEFVRMK